MLDILNSYIYWYRWKYLGSILFPATFDALGWSNLPPLTSSDCAKMIIWRHILPSWSSGLLYGHIKVKSLKRLRWYPLPIFSRILWSVRIQHESFHRKLFITNYRNNAATVIPADDPKQHMFRHFWRRLCQRLFDGQSST